MIGACNGRMYVERDGTRRLISCPRSARLYWIASSEPAQFALLCRWHHRTLVEFEIVQTIPEPDCGPNWIRDRMGDTFVVDEAKRFNHAEDGGAVPAGEGGPG